MHFQLEFFEGPLELLLHLIEKNEIDINNIPMARLTTQYLEAIRQIPADMEGMSEFLVMAATLLEIKSRMLLPKRRTDEEDEEDPRVLLVRQLIAYKKCQELAAVLKDMPDAGQRLFGRPEYPLMADKLNIPNAEEWLSDVRPWDLWEIFRDVMQRREIITDTVRHNFGTVPRERYTLADKVRLIFEVLQKEGKIRLSALFSQCRTKEECVVTFLAMLELIRRNQANVRQDEVFGEIEVVLCG